MLGKREFEGFERHAGARVRGNFERAQPERLQDLKKAVIRWRLEGHQVAGPRYGSQAQIDRLHAPRRRNQVAIVNPAAPFKRAARDCAAQFLRARRHAIAPKHPLLALQLSHHYASHPIESKQLSAGTGRAEGPQPVPADD